MPYERLAGRGLLVTPDGATMLVLGHDPADPGRGQFLWTPGGGVDPGESIEDATRRELREEVGYIADELGPVVLERVSEFDFGGRSLRQTESFFLIEIDVPFDAESEALSALEDDAIIDFVWLRPDEMRSSTAPVYPACLPALIDHVVRSGRPAEPWVDSSA